MSAVAGKLRRQLYEVTGLHQVFNDTNVRIELKSSPEKTAAALSVLAEQQGQVHKLNDTGSWKLRRGYIVPHTFLYYFGEMSAAMDLSPHGVIDLELYTDIQIVDENVVRLAPGDENSPIRTFFLRLESRKEAEEWAQGLRETRFDHVREERDALRSAKAVMTEQLVSLSENLRECRASLETSQRREAAAVSELARSDAKEAKRVEQVQALLASARDGDGRNGRQAAGIGSCAAGSLSGGEAACALSELAALEEAIAERACEVAALKAANAALVEDAAVVDEHRRRDAAAALKLLAQQRARATDEAAARGLLEEELRALRLELDETRAGREEARANLGVVAASRREAEVKARELQEHRWVLAREVKALRAEKRRLSAVLSCATTAAATAAATVAATAGAVGNRDRTSSAVSWVAGDGARAIEHSDQGGPGGDRSPVAAEGDGRCLAAGDGATSGDNPSATLPDPNIGLVQVDAGRVAGGSGWEGTEAPADACDGRVEAASPWLRSSFLDAPRSSSGVVVERARNGGSGTTSPEAGSPTLCDRRSRPDWRPSSPPSNSNAAVPGASAAPTNLGARAAQAVSVAPVDAPGTRGAEGDSSSDVPVSQGGCHGDESLPAQNPDSGTANSRPRERCSSEPPIFPSAVTASATGASGESRFNQMVQSFSIGLRESRRGRRTPLLGSLDDDSDAGGEAEAEGEADDDGGVTDGTDGDSRHESTATTRAKEEDGAWSAWSTVGGGESYHGGAKGSSKEAGNGRAGAGAAVAAAATATAVSAVASAAEDGCAEAAGIMRGDVGAEKDAAVAAIEDTCDGGAAGGGACFDGSERHMAHPNDQQLAAKDAGGDQPAEALGPSIGATAVRPTALPIDAVDAPSTWPPSSPVVGWRNSLEAVADAAAETAAKATESSADWFRKVGRRDGEDSLPREGPSQAATALPPSSLTEGRVDSGAGDLQAEEGSGMPTAAAAAAAAVAAHGGRVSLEAAAAARRWEAKLKGSLVSMTDGVRWGMGAGPEPQWLNGEQ